MKKFLLIDGDSLLFKSFYALIRQAKNFVVPLSGLHTNGIYEFNIALCKLIKRFQPNYALVAWDAGSTTFRTKMYPDYKGNRNKTPDILKEQFMPTMQLVKAHGIKNYELPNYEADDIVGTMAYRADKQGFQTDIITGDRDYTQLCSNHSTVYLSRRGVTNLTKLTPNYLKKTLGLTPDQIVDKKALQGDSSDNYPGITGVGSKRADKLVVKYGSVKGIYQHLDQIHAKALHKHLAKDKLVCLLALKLAKIDRHSPVKIKLSDCKYRGNNLTLLKSMYKQLAFKKFLTKLNALK